MTRKQLVEKGRTSCFIQGCKNKVTFSRTVRLLSDIQDYEIDKGFCSRHKKSIKGIEVLSSLKLKRSCQEVLLGSGKAKEKQSTIKDTLQYMYEQAIADNRDKRMEAVINAAQHFARVGDAKFGFGFYFGILFFLSSSKDLGTDVKRQKRAEQVRKQMGLRELYVNREHPDNSNEMVEICNCGHQEIMHACRESPTHRPAIVDGVIRHTRVACEAIQNLISNPGS